MAPRAIKRHEIRARSGAGWHPQLACRGPFSALAFTENKAVVRKKRGRSTVLLPSQTLGENFSEGSNGRALKQLDNIDKFAES
jgi:hypothetical protein